MLCWCYCVLKFIWLLCRFWLWWLYELNDIFCDCGYVCGCIIFWLLIWCCCTVWFVFVLSNVGLMLGFKVGFDLEFDLFYFEPDLYFEFFRGRGGTANLLTSIALLFKDVVEDTLLYILSALPTIILLLLFNLFVITLYILSFPSLLLLLLFPIFLLFCMLFLWFYF